MNDESLGILHDVLLMLMEGRAPICIKDIATNTPKVRRYLPVLGVDGYDLWNPLERLEWQTSCCDLGAEEPFDMAAIDAELAGDFIRLIPEDGKPWADALKAMVADAFGRQLDAWAERNGFYVDGRQSAAI